MPAAYNRSTALDASGVKSGMMNAEFTGEGAEREPAPIALFVFRRLEHVRLTIEALQANALADRSSLYVFCDGPRSECDEADIAKVRDYVKNITGFARVFIIEHQTNIGLARSIISGITEVLTKNDHVIVVEDDLVTSIHFLRYMNDGLKTYQNDQHVASIHGYIYPVATELPETFFLRGADCWGWATWRRAWTKFEPDALKLLDRLHKENLTYRFDMDASYGFYEMLQANSEGRNDSWAIRWHASAFLENMLTLYPRQSLVNNIGLDASGTHCAATEDYTVNLCSTPITVGGIPIIESQIGRKAVIEFFQRQR